VRQRGNWEHSIKTCLKDTADGDFGWMNLAENNFRWWALVKTVMKFGFHKT
jgi:hypothetical protein